MEKKNRRQNIKDATNLFRLLKKDNKRKQPDDHVMKNVRNRLILENENKWIIIRDIKNTFELENEEENY